MTKCCRHCHFLARCSHTYPEDMLDLPPEEGTDPHPGWEVHTWSKYDRADLSIEGNLDGSWVAECWKGVRSKRINPGLKEKELLLQDHGADCFFIEVHEGMSFQAAEDLFRLRNDSRQR